MKNPEHPSQPHADPLIDEIRAIREQISNQFGNDVGQLCDFLRNEQHRHGHRVVEESEPALPETTK